MIRIGTLLSFILISLIAVVAVLAKLIYLDPALVDAGKLPSVAANLHIIPYPKEISMQERRDCYFIKSLKDFSMLHLRGISFSEGVTKAEQNIMKKHTKKIMGDNSSSASEIAEIQLSFYINPNASAKPECNNTLIPEKDESYILEMLENGTIKITANATQGLFYGLQTLNQILYQISPQTLHNFPCLTIKDSPRFPYRGFMLDEGRHLHGVQEIKRLLDIMASL